MGSICKEKDFEGLGVKNLTIMNEAFLAKLAYMTCQEPLWARVLRAKYDTAILSTFPRQGFSQAWRSITTGMAVILKGMAIGRG